MFFLTYLTYLVLTSPKVLIKLQHYGIKNSTRKWIKDFLSARSQRVVLDGQSSNDAPVTSGVLQGTFIGPLLFWLSFRNRDRCRTKTGTNHNPDPNRYRIHCPDPIARIHEALSDPNAKTQDLLS